MGKINDPREDHSAVAMRSLRANNAYKYIKKLKTSKFNDDKLKLKKTDTTFYHHFMASSDIIKQEFVYLWEEVGQLNERINRYNDVLTEMRKKELESKLEQTEESPKPPKKRLYVFGP